MFPARLAKAPGRGYYLEMPEEPELKRAVAYFDGQNFYRCAKEAFGIIYPSFDPIKLAQEVCKDKGWSLTQVRFYTGMPDKAKDPHWNYFWTEKLRAIGRRPNAKVITRPLRYRTAEVQLPDGTFEDVEYKVEKGIDVRLSIDVVKAAIKHEYDVALIFSQDQDLAEVVEDIVECAKETDRWVKVASAFPEGPQYSNRRGVANTDWIKINQFLYDQCLDPSDYRPKTKAKRS